MLIKAQSTIGAYGAGKLRCPMMLTSGAVSGFSRRTPENINVIRRLAHDRLTGRYIGRTYGDDVGQLLDTLDHVYLFVPPLAYVASFLETFREFPPRQKPTSFSIDQVMEKLQDSGGLK